MVADRPAYVPGSRIKPTLASLTRRSLPRNMGKELQYCIGIVDFLVLS